MSPPRTQRSDPLDSSRHSAAPSQTSSNLYSNDGSAPSLLSGAAPVPTYASFSPATLSSTAPSATSAAKRRSTILVHQKSPLLLATPPQITRALAYSHPFLLPLNRLVGLLTWTTGDPWESFLLVAVFWGSVLYGDTLVRLAGPVVLVLILIGGMYGRRFSPLSSSGWSEPGLGTADGTAVSTEARSGTMGKKTGKTKNLTVDGLPDKNGKATGGAGAGAGGGHRRNQSSVSEITNTRHQKTLDEIVETLKEFTARCNILLEPLLELTDFLSTQRTPTSATTRPALTTLFVRILLCTPFWFALTLPPLRIITTRRVILFFGTLILTWHSRVMRVARIILWRSASLRRALALITGLQFEEPVKASATPASLSTESSATSAAGASKVSTTGSLRSRESELTKALRRARGGHDAGVRFTFIIYENQRRWVGLGWTTSLFAYERPAWTDEHNNSVPPRDQFELPEVEDGSNMRWRWVEGSRWRVDGVPDEAVAPAEKDKEWDYDGPGGKMGWVYYDNKWQNGRRGQDGWGRWTRRRKWYRDAELVEADVEIEPASGSAEIGSQTATPTPAKLSQQPSSETETQVPARSSQSGSSYDVDKEMEDDYDGASILSTSSRSARFKPPTMRRRVTDSSHRSRRTSVATSEDDAASLGTQVGLALQGAGKEGESWGVGDEVRMGLE
ncbi:integral peroxisomal membrane peroxin-domain-containing protein [Echria macrotheca]|uniref:Integral peroxisomal membrane peroxin-domain-containing protein n=1 Tax=Echria macrotheca TaxID=438768 RepID=A0AAJ0F8C5_9PEZI|nr:integral peroxisomal membrane peroxin-domain-containing protein [Echria macrotheca]